jgi:signal transduction histidine kinase
LLVEDFDAEIARHAQTHKVFTDARVMEPLFSTKAHGMGLGLALSRMILDRNRGSLRVVSELGNGSTFTVRLAVATSEGEMLR